MTIEQARSWAADDFNRLVKVITAHCITPDWAWRQIERHRRLSEYEADVLWGMTIDYNSLCITDRERWLKRMITANPDMPEAGLLELARDRPEYRECRSLKACLRNDLGKLLDKRLIHRLPARSEPCRRSTIAR
ncbi:hypothetical protein ACFPFP_17540 [Bradyrhizobium sp. GCM10023182]|uniref:Uncharacterized protein n=1 Tax=Bradyrhizobium zhengyangense TaxID=2911009 RepID=A0ABS9LPZ5_9BRAD|nr:hypothetical protein [Bradyrhizobium zhengyangense]MCG2668757.1 hypothetical protein [Bradyrhizobium zhengyangense]